MFDKLKWAIKKKLRLLEKELEWLQSEVGRQYVSGTKQHSLYFPASTYGMKAHENQHE